MKKNKKKFCPYCQTEIEKDEIYVICSRCKISHHEECWNQNSRCTTYGCKGLKRDPRFMKEVDLEKDIRFDDLEKYRKINNKKSNDDFEIYLYTNSNKNKKIITSIFITFSIIILFLFYWYLSK